MLLMGDRTRRLSINLSADAAEAIEEITKSQDISITETIRRAISALKVIEEAVRRNARIYIKDPGEPMKELVFVGLIPGMARKEGGEN